MYNRIVACLALAASLLPSVPFAADPPPLAIRGYDPVAYFTLQRATPGNKRFEYFWDERVYRFTSAEHRERFKADPVRYAPQFANFCAVALARGEVREANPEYWLISDGKLYLFGKSVGPGLFQQDIAGNLRRAHGNRALLTEKKKGTDLFFTGAPETRQQPPEK